MIYLEDIPLNQRMELGTYTFTEDNIIAFAKQWDPQPFHTDPVAARDSIFGGLVASGWHVACVWMKLMVGARTRTWKERGEAYGGGVSPGFRELKWLHPVRPGDVLGYSTTTLEYVELKSRPEFGILRSRNEAVNQDGIKVLSFVGQAYMPRRPKED